MANGSVIGRVAIFGLAMALLLAIVTLFASRRELAAIKAERAQLLEWQSGILRQLARASRSAGMASPAPADASEELAEIIASREAAIKLLAAPSTYSLAAPEQRPQAERPAKKPDTIGRLMNRRSTGAAAEDVQAIEQDSQTPWNGWE